MGGVMQVLVVVVETEEGVSEGLSLLMVAVVRGRVIANDVVLCHTQAQTPYVAQVLVCWQDTVA
jgi:hypothetical protein